MALKAKEGTRKAEKASGDGSKSSTSWNRRGRRATPIAVAVDDKEIDDDGRASAK